MPAVLPRFTRETDRLLETLKGVPKVEALKLPILQHSLIRKHGLDPTQLSLQTLLARIENTQRAIDYEYAMLANDGEAVDVREEIDNVRRNLLSAEMDVLVLQQMELQASGKVVPSETLQTRDETAMEILRLLGQVKALKNDSAARQVQIGVLQNQCRTLLHNVKATSLPHRLEMVRRSLDGPEKSRVLKLEEKQADLERQRAVLAGVLRGLILQAWPNWVEVPSIRDLMLSLKERSLEDVYA